MILSLTRKIRKRQCLQGDELGTDAQKRTSPDLSHSQQMQTYGASNLRNSTDSDTRPYYKTEGFYFTVQASVKDNYKSDLVCN